MLSHGDIAWWHSIDLGNGEVTKGVKPPELLEAEFARLGLTRQMLSGKRVLDVGCADGYMSLRCEKLGAEVTGVDVVYRDGLKYVRRHLKPRFRFYSVDVLSNSFNELGRFDVVLYLGVLYHTMYPFEHLLRLAKACNSKGILFLETEYYNLPGFQNEPTIFFNYSGQVVRDASSPVFPSIRWIEQTLEKVGFTNVNILHRVGTPPMGEAIRGRLTLCAEYNDANLSPVVGAAEQAV